MNLSAVFALIFAAQSFNLPSPRTLIDTYVYLPANKNATFLLIQPKPDAALSVKVTGNGKDKGKGDVDCYLIANGKVLVKDEDSKDSCELVIVPGKQDITIWVVQHGTAAVDYHVVATQ
jgi:hypothetical protein